MELSKPEILFIRANAHKMTDRAITNILNKLRLRPITEWQVSKVRRKFGINKQVEFTEEEKSFIKANGHRLSSLQLVEVLNRGRAAQGEALLTRSQVSVMAKKLGIHYRRGRPRKL